MNSTSDPIGLFGKLNVGVLLAVTPEYGKIKAARREGAGFIASSSRPIVMQTKYRTIAGVKVRFAEGGKQDGPLVVLLSPQPQSILCYDPIWTRIGEHCRLVALDLPGFGRSEGGLEFMSFDAQSRFLDEFVRALNLKQMHIVGPDIGMAVALHYAIHRDHEAASLIIGDGPGILPTANGSIINKAVNSDFWRMMFRITGARSFVDGAVCLALVNYSPSAEEVADYVLSYDGRIGPITHWFATYPENLATVDPHLAELDLPVKVFWGDLDQFLFVDNAHRLNQHLKRSELTVFDNYGHFSYQDKADEFAEMILTWVGGRFREICAKPYG
jgi:pimeloyl-ACP methyl ester carboxylesterase